jgi:hypothetical protein
MQVGYITNQKASLSQLAAAYVHKLRSVIKEFGHDVIGEDGAVPEAQ